MRLAWYAGASSALAVSIIFSAFHQRANFYSAMVYLSQSNFCLLVLINFLYILYGCVVYALQRIFFGQLRPVEVEQLSDRAWIAITETCLAMTIFREEIGAWFLVMFTGLVTGKVWGWIGDGRVETLEQQPPSNPVFFHLRLSVSLLISVVYDIWILQYSISTVIQQARPNMMVMFLFEFAILTTSSLRTLSRYILVFWEAYIVKNQTKSRLEERRREVREQHAELARARELAAAQGLPPPEEPEDLPREEDIDEMDIEVPGWETKGQWVLSLELFTDLVKLLIYMAFFTVLLMFYGLPVHIMRDVYMTASAFFKRLSALIKYRRAIQSIRKYPDATQEDIDREDTCIICREEMRPWLPDGSQGPVERTRPKKLPCGHILHFGCLKSWLERQQVCPICRSPVVQDNPNAVANRGPGADAARNPPPGPNGHAAGAIDGAGADPAGPQPGDGNIRRRQFNLGPFRFEFFRQDLRNLPAGALFPGLPEAAQAQQPQPQPQQQPQQPQLQPPQPQPPQAIPAGAAAHVQGGNTPAGTDGRPVRLFTTEFDHLLNREVVALQTLQHMQQELQTAHLLMAELVRLRQLPHQIYDSTTPHAPSPANHVHTTPATLPQNNFHGIPLYPAQTLPHQTFFPPPPAQFPAHQYPSFTSYPAPRIGTPSLPGITRHTAASNATAIQSGSPDLPEGVVIPPGWTLLPLQRMESTVPLAGGATAPATNSNPTSVPLSTGGTAIRPQSTERASLGDGALRTETTESTSARSAEPSSRGAESSQRDDTREPSTSDQSANPVVAPNPVLPNWGTTSQFFGNTTRAMEELGTSVDAAPLSAATSTTEELPKPSKQVSSQAEASIATQSDAERSDAPGKGKGRAVTVEEGDEE